MKKFLIGLLTACALAFSVAQVFAEVPLTYVRERVPFRKQYLSYQGYYDSITVTQTGTANAWTADTTAAITLFQPPPRLTASAADSVYWFSFQFVPTANSDVTVSADSIYLVQQVSWDAKNWQTVTPTALFYPANEMPTVVASVGPAQFILETGSVNCFQHQCKFVWAALGNINGPAEAATTAPTAVMLGAYKFIRFIVVGDWGGRYEAYVNGPRSILSNGIGAN